MSSVVIAVHDHPQRDTFPQQLGFFTERILPGVTAMPGFVTGRWAYDRASSRTHSYVVFATAADAQQLVDHLRGQSNVPNPFGVTLVSVTLAEETVSR